VVGVDCRIERGGGQTLVLREQVVGEGMKVSDAADHRGPGDEVIAAVEQPADEFHVFGVTPHEAVSRMVAAGGPQLAIFGEIVEADDVPAGVQELADDVAADEPGGTGDEDLHR